MTIQEYHIIIGILVATLVLQIIGCRWARRRRLRRYKSIDKLIQFGDPGGDTWMVLRLIVDKLFQEEGGGRPT